MILHAMHYFMKKLITFTDDSAARLSEHILGIDSPPGIYNASRLLGRQLKHAMHVLLKGLTKDVLENLEGELKKKTQSSWPSSFCVILILCLCTEDIEVAADMYVRYGIDDVYYGRRCESYKICQILESEPYRQFTQLFHDFYGTFKQPNGHRTDGCFNPILNGVNNRLDWSQPTRNMVYDIRRILDDYRRYIPLITWTRLNGSR